MQRLRLSESLRRPTLCGSLVCGVLITAATAGEPRLDRIEPQGARRGTTATVDAYGPWVGKAPQGFLFSRSGLELKKVETIDDNHAKVELAVAADCPLGIHPLRLRTSSGLSNLVQFHVGALAEATEVEPNDSRDAAQTIAIDMVVNGVVKPAESDFYAVEVAAGERLSVEVEGLRLGRTLFDPAITVLDPAGREIATADDSGPAYRDAFCSLVAKDAGKYAVVVRESSLGGDDLSTYRLHVGRFPRPMAITPLGGRPGEKLKVRWIGDALGDRDEEIELPTGPCDRFPAFAVDDRGASPTPIMLRVVDVPNAIEVEPNERETATTAPFPAALEGCISAPHDFDWFRLPLKVGQAVDLRMYARVAGSPLDGIVRVFKADGGELAANDDDQGEPDSYLRFAPPADSDYFVRIEDRLDRGGPTFVYRVEATLPAAIVDVRIEEQVRYESQRVVVPQGNRAAIMVVANRRDTGGPLIVSASELPTGVTAAATPLAEDYNLVPMVFEAAPDAPQTAGLYSLSATTGDESKAVLSRFLQQSWLVRGRNNFPMWNQWAERPPIAVVEPVPFKLTLVQPQAPLVQTGSKDLKIVAERSAGFTAPIRLRALYVPPGMSTNNSLTIAEGQSEGILPTSAAWNAKVGEFDFAVIGEADVAGNVAVSTQMAKVRVAPGYVGLAFATVATQQGTNAEYAIGVEQRTPFEGKAVVELLGLPPGVTAPTVEINKTADKVVFPLAVAPDARTGRHPSLMCRVTITEHGEPVIHMLGTGELRVDPRPPQGDAS